MFLKNNSTKNAFLMTVLLKAVISETCNVAHMSYELSSFDVLLQYFNKLDSSWSMCFYFIERFYYFLMF